MKTRIGKCGIFMVGLLALMVFFLGNANIVSAGKVGDVKFKVTEIEYVDSRTVMVKGWFYNTGREGEIVHRIMYHLKARGEDGELIFETQGNRMQAIQPTRVPMNSQSEPCTILLSDNDIRPYDGEVEWTCGIMSIVSEPIR